MKTGEGSYIPLLAPDYLRSDLWISSCLCHDLSGCFVIQPLLSAEKIVQGNEATEERTHSTGELFEQMTEL